jgi:hypothetical protein
MSQNIIVAFYLLSLLLSATVAYFTTTYSLRREMRHGVLRLIELCRRYLFNLLNAFDQETRRLRSDELSRDVYVTELQVVVNQLDSLLDNAYVGRLAINYPLVSLLLAQVRRELVELNQTKVLHSLNPTAVGLVAGLYRKVKKDLPAKYFRNPYDETLEEGISKLEATGVIKVPS